MDTVTRPTFQPPRIFEFAVNIKVGDSANITPTPDLETAQNLLARVKGICPTSVLMVRRPADAVWKELSTDSQLIRLRAEEAWSLVSEFIANEDLPLLDWDVRCGIGAPRVGGHSVFLPDEEVPAALQTYAKLLGVEVSSQPISKGVALTVEGEYRGIQVRVWAHINNKPKQPAKDDRPVAVEK